MKQDLPKVYASKINKKINNSQDVFYEDKNRSTDVKDSRTINKKIADIFNSSNFVYKRDVTITTREKSTTKTIVGRRGNYLLTMDNEVINIDEIIDIN